MELEPITRQEKIIAGQDLTPITRMEKFLKQFGGGGGGLPTGGAPYQHLVTDGEGNAKWEDRLCHAAERVKVDLFGTGMFFYKVSDTIPTGDLSGGAHATIWHSINPTEVLTVTELRDGFYMISDSAFVVLYDNFKLNDTLIPEKGTYFSLANEFNWASGLALGEATTPEITWDGNPEIIKKLDEKYLQNRAVVFTEDANGHVMCNISYDDLGYLVYFGVPILANFVSPGNYCATIQAFKLDGSSIRFLFTTLNDDNSERTYKYIYKENGTIEPMIP